MSRTRIWVPELEPPVSHMTVDLKFGIEGYFKMELIRAATGEIEKTLEFKNKLNTVATEKLGRGDSALIDLFQACFVGTGPVTGAFDPSIYNLQLAQSLAGTQFNGGFGDGFLYSGNSAPLPADHPYWEYQIHRQFLETEANGDLTEIAMSNTLGVIHNRVAIKDLSGTPMVLTKTSDFQLRVTYRYRVYPDVQSYSGSFTAYSQSFNYVTHPVATDLDSAWGPNNNGILTQFGSYGIFSTALETQADIGITGSLGFGRIADSVVVGGYTPSSSMREATALYGPTYVPATGIQAVTFAFSLFQNNRCDFATFFTPKLPKTNLNKFFITYRWSWGSR